MSDGKGNVLDRYVAPGLLFGGIGVTAYRTWEDYADGQGAERVKNIWNNESQFTPMLDAIKKRPSEYGPEFIVSKTTSRIKDATDKIIEEAQRRGYTGGEQTQAAVNQAIKEHLMYNVSSANQTQFDSFEQLIEMAQKDKSVAVELERGMATLGSDPTEMLGVMSDTAKVRAGETLGAAFADDRYLREYGPGRGMTVERVAGREALEQALGGFSSPTEIDASKRLLAEVNALDGHKLSVASRDGTPFALRVSSGKDAFFDVPLSDSAGNVKLGAYGLDDGVSVRVASDRLVEMVSGPRGHIPMDLGTVSATEATIDYATAQLNGGYGVEDIRTGFKDLVQNMSDDTTAPFRRGSGNRALDRRVAGQVTLKSLPIGPALSEGQIEAFDQIVRSRGFDPLEGVSASQATSGTRAMPSTTLDSRGAPIGNTRMIGARSLGQSTGASKDVAQGIRGDMFVHRTAAPGVPVVSGIEQMLTGEAGSIQFANIALAEEDFMKRLLEQTSLAGSGMSEDTLFAASREMLEEGGATLSKSSYEIMLDASPAKEGRAAALEDILSGKTTSLPAASELGYDASGRKIVTQGQLDISNASLREIDIGGDVKKRVMKVSGRETILGDVGMKVFGRKAVIGGVFQGEGEIANAATIIEARKAGLFANDDVAIAAMHHMQNNTPDDLIGFLGREGFSAEEFAAFEQAAERGRTATFIGTQGVKKIGGRGMATATENATARLAEEYMRVQGLPGDNAARMAQIEKRLISAGVATSESARPYSQQLMGYMPNRAGGIVTNGSEFLVNDARIAGRGSHVNQVKAFHNSMSATVKEGALGLNQWSIQRTIEDVLKNNPDIADSARSQLQKMTAAAAAGKNPQAMEAVARSMLSGKGVFGDAVIRSSVYASAEKQLTEGIHYGVLASGGQSGLTGGSGGRGSFTIQTFDQMRAQRGAMADFALESMTRTRGHNVDDVAALASRTMASSLRREVPGASRLELAQFTRAYNKLDHAQRRAVFGSNASTREAAFARLQELTKVDLSNGINITNSDGRMWFHPREANVTSTTTLNKYGKEMVSPLDRRFMSVLNAQSRGRTDLVNKRWSAMEQELGALVTSKASPFASMTRGKMTGSSRLQARPQFNLTKRGPVDISAQMADRVGFFESDIRKMAGDMGLDAGQAVKMLRAGNLPIAISREPVQDLYRVTAANTYSVDEAIRRGFAREVSHTGAGRTFDEVFSQLPSHDKKGLLREYRGSEKLAMRGRAYETRLRLDGITDPDVLRDTLTEALQKKELPSFGESRRAAVENVKGRYAGVSTNGRRARPFFVPKWIENILGADYDDDQLNAWFSGNSETNKALRQRATMRTDLHQLEASMAKNAGGAVQAQDVIAEYSKIHGGQTGALAGEAALGAQDYLYQRTLDYGALKSRVQDIASPEAFIPMTPEWTARTQIEGQLQGLEKRSIGRLTNSVDAIRQSLRDGQGGNALAMNVEQQLGLIGETSIKARHAGTGREALALIQDVHELTDVIGGRSGLSQEETATSLKRLISSLYPEGTKGREGLISSADTIAEGIKLAQSSETFSVRAMTKSGKADAETVGRMMSIFMDTEVPSEVGDVIKGALGAEDGTLDLASRQLKNSMATGDDIWRTIVKHKKPVIVGALSAVAIAALFGGNRHISEEEAQAAGARHGRPSNGQADHDRSVPIEMGRGGRSVRVRGNYSGQIDPADVASQLKGAMPNANLRMDINDMREQINNEYIRKRTR